MIFGLGDAVGLALTPLPLIAFIALRGWRKKARPMRTAKLAPVTEIVRKHPLRRVGDRAA